MKEWLALVVTCVFVVSFASNAFAQPAFEGEDGFDKDNILRRFELDGRVMNDHSPGNTGREADGVGRFNESNYADSAYSNADQWCETDENGIIDDCSGMARQEDYFEGGERKSNVIAFNPMAGFHDTAQSKVYTKALDSVLDSDLIVMNVTWNLTEPGVSRGISQGTTMANEWLANRYRSDLAFIKRAEQSLESRELVLQAYNSCIADYMTGRRKGTGSINGDKLRWIEAQSRCLGGARYNDEVATSSGSSSPTNLSEWDRIAALDDNPNFKIVDHSAHPGGQNAEMDQTDGSIWNEVLGRVRDNENQEITEERDHLTVVDWLFQEEKKASHFFDWYGTDVHNRRDTPDNINVIDKAKQSWRSLYGDVVFTLSSHPGDVMEGRVKEFQYKRIPPFQPGSTRMKAGPQWYKRGLTRQIYHQLSAIMHNRCVFQDTVVDGGDADPFDWLKANKLSATDRHEFWNDEDFLFGRCTGCVNLVEVYGANSRTYVDPAYVKMVGFSLQPHVGDMLFSMFLMEEGAHTRGEYDCASLDPNAAANIDNIMGGSTWLDGSTELRNRVNDRIRNWWYLADRIATGQLLMTFKRSEDVISKLTGGAVETTMRSIVLQQIKEASGKQPIHQAYEHNLSRLNTWLEVQYHRRANEIGVTDMLGRDAVNEDGDPMNGFQGSG